jgi:hypothetical protein
MISLDEEYALNPKIFRVHFHSFSNQTYRHITQQYIGLFTSLSNVRTAGTKQKSSTKFGQGASVE